MATITKVFNCFNAPKGKPVSSGSPIYEWEYYDDVEVTRKNEDGEEEKYYIKKKKTKKKNVQEEIQSHLSSVDYKRKILTGEEAINEAILGDTIKDFTNLPGDKVDFIDFINLVSKLDENQITDYIQQITQGTAQDSETAQVTTETTTPTGETQSATGDTTPATDEGGN